MSDDSQLSLPLGSAASTEPEWRVRRSTRARRLGLRMFHDGSFELVVPERLRRPDLGAFVARHQDWIARQRRRYAAQSLPQPEGLLRLQLLGEDWPAGEAPQDPRACRLLMRRLARRAKFALAAAIGQVAAAHGCRPRAVRVRWLRTRWGSCSASGVITLNCCLLFQRAEVVRYLCAHELAHLAHMNHSTRFWAQVERYEPGWRELDAELVGGWRHVPRWLLSALRA
jgi:predicted metal-dependent hydrolase